MPMQDMTLEELNAELVDVGLKPVKSWEEARRKRGTSLGYSEPAKQQSKGDGAAKVVRRNPEASEPQKSYIKKLAATKQIPADKIEHTQNILEQIEKNTLAKKDASAAIDTMIAWSWIPREPVQHKAVVKPAVEVETVEPGMYLKNGEVFKVQVAVHGSGKPYAKMLVGGKFEYAPGKIRELLTSDKMTREQAKEYGALYGVCCQCGKTLTDEQSIENGIGPSCAKKDVWA